MLLLMFDSIVIQPADYRRSNGIDAVRFEKNYAKWLMMHYLVVLIWPHKDKALYFQFIFPLWQEHLD